MAGTSPAITRGCAHSLISSWPRVSRPIHALLFCLLFGRHHLQQCARSVVRIRGSAGSRVADLPTRGNLPSHPARAAPGRDEGPEMTDTVLILDFGSQVTQLIARRVR